MGKVLIIKNNNKYKSDRYKKLEKLKEILIRNILQKISKR